MSVLVTEFLAEISDNGKFADNTHDPNHLASQVIMCLGGFDKVINLCLTHNISIEDDKYCKNAVSSLRALMTIKELNKEAKDQTSNVDNKNPTYSFHSNSNDIKQTKLQSVAAHSPSSSMTALPMNINQIGVQTSSSITNDMNSDNHNENDGNNIIIAQNRAQFDSKSVVLHANVKNSLCYRWLGNDAGDLLTSFVLYNKWYNRILAVLIIGSLLVSELIKEMNQSAHTYHSISYLVLRGLPCFCMPIWVGSWVLIMNIDVLKIVLHTFEFWFKLWNLVLWSMSFIWINTMTTDRYVSDLVFTTTCLILGAMCFLLLDALPISYQFKRMLIILAIFAGIVGSIGAYFNYSDVLCNPFKKYHFKHTQISLKGIFVGSYFNIILFVAKPLFGDIKDMLKPFVKMIKYKYKNDTGVRTNNKRCHDHINERLVCVYKRPKIRWNHASITASALNQTQILAKHANDH